MSPASRPRPGLWARCAAALMLTLAACGETPTTPALPDAPATSPTPPAPPSAPIIPALIEGIGGANWVRCDRSSSGSCAFETYIQNRSDGCAMNVRGTTAMRDRDGLLLGSYAWTAGDVLMRPRDVLLYTIPTVPYSIVERMETYKTSPEWHTVRCP